MPLENPDLNGALVDPTSISSHKVDSSRQHLITRSTAWPSMPAGSVLPINRCNLPARIISSLTFQQHPTQLTIDGVETLHNELFETLDTVRNIAKRAEHFMDYMRSGFLLEHPERIGLQHGQHINRSRADYLRLLRGWLFDSDSTEGAVMKGWVESRFGLIPRFHHKPITDPESASYLEYLTTRMSGLYNANSLESQLDLLFSWCQYEYLRRRQSFHQTGKEICPIEHVLLYRGINDLASQTITTPPNNRELILCLNNLNSFSSDQDTAATFGDHVIMTQVPVSKLLYFPGLLPGLLQGESEYIAVGGLYRAKLL